MDSTKQKAEHPPELVLLFTLLLAAPNALTGQCDRNDQCEQRVNGAARKSMTQTPDDARRGLVACWRFNFYRGDHLTTAPR